MIRVVAQHEMFAQSSPAPEAPAPVLDPMDELHALHARLAASAPDPWPSLSVAISEELHAMRLAEAVGPAADAIKEAILREYFRLHRLGE